MLKHKLILKLKEKTREKENCFDELDDSSARPNAIVTVVALYDKAQTLPLPDMYGKNLTFKTGGRR